MTKVASSHSAVPNSLSESQENGIPILMQHYQYIFYGYRKTPTVSKCFKSVFELHNETINIWTHVIGFCVFFLLMAYDNLVILPNSQAKLMDHIVLTCGLASFQFCMGASVAYHILNSYNVHMYRCCLLFDTLGICVAILGCYFPALYLGFACHPTWARFYFLLVSIFIVMLVGLLCYDYCIQRKFACKHTENASQESGDKKAYRAWRKKSMTGKELQLLPLTSPNERRIVNVSLFVLISAFGCVPALHWVWLHGGIWAPVVAEHIPRIFVVYGLCLLALGFYLTKFPECAWPGKFDIVGASHQWWHVLVIVLLLYAHHVGGELYYDHKLAKCR